MARSQHYLNQQYINGEWRDGELPTALVDRNPFTGEPFATFPSIAGPSDIDAAYQSARGATKAWAMVNAYDKQNVFDRAIEYVKDHETRITQHIMDELGGTHLKAGFEIGLVLDMLREAATLPLRMDGDIRPSDVHGAENRVYREPVGVVGVISPFNFPFFLSMKAVAPALAAGNGVVLKPHEDAPVTGGTLIAEIFEHAGLPAGLLNVVVTTIDAIGNVFLEHPTTNLIVFTGSAPVGTHVATIAARHNTKTVLELGGNSAFIVLADADIGQAVDAALFSRMAHSGQVCMAANRILIDRRVYEEFAGRFVAKAAALTVGDPRDPSTDIGPLINQRQVDRLMAQIELAVDEGARLALPGKVEGLLVSPVVLADVTPDMTFAHEELFGPVVSLMPFDTEAQAIEIANNTRYGLSGAIHTKDLDHGVELAKQINTGMCHVNGPTIKDEVNMPFGGNGASGRGDRLGGEHNLYVFTKTKWISVERERRSYPW